ncbi:MAG: hypothetical protein ACI8PZ_003622 [Myxococcota bacterium]|jgi:hypothetical protein
MGSAPAVERIARFEAGEVPAAFGHRDHIAICWDLLEVYGLLDTLVRLPAALRRIVAAAGVPDKFNATQTACWILLVAERKAGAASVEALLSAHPELFTDLPRQRYGAALHDPRWKRRFLPPPEPVELEVVPPPPLVSASVNTASRPSP